MPAIGERCPHDCPDCGQPMYWSDVDAYRCAKGHTSQQCPICGSYETAAWTDAENRHYHVICGSCGNDSIVNA